MAAKTPTMTRSTAGFTEPGKSLYTGVNAVDADLITNGTHVADRNGFKLDVFYFSDIDDADTWASGIKSIQAVAWQADQADTDKVAATLTAAATGTITFDAENANSNGWLWVLHG